MSKNILNPLVEDVAENVGSFIEYWGFKKVHGKIWALIFLAEKPVDANYLIKNLNISKALVSMSIKDLLDYKVILPCKEKMSTLHYVANPNIVDVIADVLMQREAKMLLKVRSSCELLQRAPKSKIENHVSQERLDDLQKMTKLADSVLTSALAFKSIDLSLIKKALIIRGNKKNNKESNEQ